MATNIYKIEQNDFSDAEIAAMDTINPYLIALTPVNPPNSRICPACGGVIPRLEDGDSLYVGDVLPDGVHDYDMIDTLLMVGTCKKCRQKSYIYEVAFSTVPDPANDGVFVLDNIDPDLAKQEYYKATNQFGEEWRVERNIFSPGKLPKGPCVIDRHTFGPFLLAEPEKVMSAVGVSCCQREDVDIWQDGSLKVYLISSSAMKLLGKATA